MIEIHSTLDMLRGWIQTFINYDSHTIQTETFTDFFPDLSGLSNLMQCLFSPLITHSYPLDLEQKQIDQTDSDSSLGTSIASRAGME